MMKKLTALCLVLLVLLCGTAYAAKTDYVGEWILTDIESDGQHYNPEQQNASMSMTLRTDGTVLLERKGYSGEGSWEETSTGVTVYDSNGSSTKFKMKSGKLVYVSGADVVRTFTRKCTASDVLGTWVLHSVEFEGTVYTAEEMGLDLTMTLRANGSAYVYSSTISTEEEGRWKIQNLDGVVYEGVGTPMAFTLVGRKLVGQQMDGLILTLVRGSAVQAVPGDADGDASVGIADAIAILDYCSGGSAGVNTANADVNGDGSVDIHDALLILQYLAGWNVTLQ